MCQVRFDSGNVFGLTCVGLKLAWIALETCRVRFDSRACQVGFDLWVRVRSDLTHGYAGFEFDSKPERDLRSVVFLRFVTSSVMHDVGMNAHIA